MIDLKDIRKYEFGSVAWQDAMEYKIRQKMRHNEELGGAEKCFLGVQKEKYWEKLLGDEKCEQDL